MMNTGVGRASGDEGNGDVGDERGGDEKWVFCMGM